MIILILSLQGAEAPGQAIKEERTAVTEEGGTTVVYNQNVSLSLEQQRQKLPVFKV
jgi:ATP-dependent RNA helicase DDX35